MFEENKRLWFQAYCALLEQGPIYARDGADTALAAYNEKFGSAPVVDVPYEGWAHLEVMGHRSHYGRVREVRWYGTKLIDIQCLDDKGELTDERHQYGGGAIFSNTPMDEQMCRRCARGEHEEQCVRCGKKTWRPRDAAWREQQFCDEHLNEDEIDENQDDDECPV